MPDELKIREALAALKPEVLKPWVKLDGLPYLHATDDPKASPWGTPVVGRFDYMETADYIAACNPVAIAELLAELDRLRTTPAPVAPAVTERASKLERGMRALMGRLASLLDEDQFKECEDIVRQAGVMPAVTDIDHFVTQTK